MKLWVSPFSSPFHLLDMFHTLIRSQLPCIYIYIYIYIYTLYSYRYKNNNLIIMNLKMGLESTTCSNKKYGNKTKAILPSQLITLHMLVKFTRFNPYSGICYIFLSKYVASQELHLVCWQMISALFPLWTFIIIIIM